MTNLETCKRFIAGTHSEGKNSGSTIFFEKNIIYSYGHHWPLGIIKHSYLFLNSDSYSNTTSKHRLSLVAANTGHYSIIDMNTSYLQELKRENYTELLEAIEKDTAYLTKYYNEKIRRARTQRSINNHQYQLKKLLDRLEIGRLLWSSAISDQYTVKTCGVV